MRSRCIDRRTGRWLGRALAAVLIAATGPLAAACAGGAAPPPYRDAGRPVDARVADLLARMTPEEKFWQLFLAADGSSGDPARYASGVCGLQIGPLPAGADVGARVDEIQRHFVEETRLGIPMIAFAEALHGLLQPDAVAFPQAIGLAATFDPELVGEAAGAIADECRAAGIRLVLSPVVNIASDARWGRVEETYGEDPWLASEMGVAFVSALERRGVVTTPKHLIANVGDGGRDSYPIHSSERLLREIHLPPFAACIRRGGARAVMTAYNSLDGTPCTAHAWLNRTVLREELGFTGLVVSDAGAVGGANVLHFTAPDYPEAGARALAGGLDVIFQTDHGHYALFLPAFLDGRIAPEVIDRAVARVLRIKFELGLFDQPYAGREAALGPGDREAHRAIALRAARESIVLLENRGGVLPLRADIGHLAVLGPDAAEARLGGYSRPAGREVSILDGIRARIGAERVVYAPGCARQGARLPTVGAEWLRGARGEYFDNPDLAGQPVFTRLDPRIDFQWTLFSPDPERLPYDFYSVRWTGVLVGPTTGTIRIGVDGHDGYRLYLDGALVIDNWLPVSRRMVLAELACERGRLYDLRLEARAPTGNAWFRLGWDHEAPAGDDARLDEAVAAAARCEAAVVVAGIEEGEFRDRARLGLPGRQEELIRRVAATGTPVIVVLVGGSAITVAPWIEQAAAVLAAWYPGEAGGEAVAEVLFGVCNPAGRLPITFPVAEGQLPLVYNHLPTGRGDDYADLTGLPQFPFGHGLSYTRFEYGDLAIEPARIPSDGAATVRVTVRNAGDRAGDEVVQLYLRDELASVARPVAELKGIRRVHLVPGEAREVRFELGPEALSMLDPDLRPVVEPGEVRVMIGASSRDIRARGILTLTR